MLRVRGALPGHGGRSLLHVATDWPGHFPGIDTTIEILVAAGADVDAQQQGGYTALHAAALHGLDDMAALLLTAGADPAVTTDDGERAVDLARRGGHDALATVLGA